MNDSPVIISTEPGEESIPTALKKFAEKAFDALDAEVSPEHITAKVSRKGSQTAPPTWLDPVPGLSP
jgi:hypothetical protein